MAAVEPTYDAFMSYSHSTDAELAPVLQRLIRRVGRPWYRRSSLRVFRDSTSLTMTAGMWDSITSAMRASRFFVLMASPAAAKSQWVQREIAFWKEHKGLSNLFIVLTEGTIVWDETATDFDWARTTALPPGNLANAFAAEPLWEDVRGARGTSRWGQRNVRLRDAARTLAAPMYGLTKEELDGEDERESRRARWFLQGSIAGLVLLLIAALGAGGVALAQRNSALAQLRDATSQAIAAESLNVADRDPELSARLALLAYEALPSARTAAALMSAVNHNRHIAAYLQPEASSTGRYADGMEAITKIEISPDGRVAAAVSSQSGQIRLWDIATRGILGNLTPDHSADGNVSPQMVFTDNGKLVVMFAGVVDMWDVATRQLIWSRSIPSGAQILSVSPDGERLALTADLSGTTTIGFELSLPSPQTPPRLVAVGADAITRTVQEITGHPSARALFPDQPRDYLDTSADGSFAATLVDNNATLETWDVNNRIRLARHTLPGEPGWTAVSVSDDGSSILVGNDLGELLLLNRDLSQSIVIGQLPAAISGLDLGNRGEIAGAVDVLGRTALFTPLRDQRFDVLPSSTHEFDPNPTLQASPDGAWLAVIYQDAAQIWDVGQRRLIGELPGGAVEFSTDSRRIATIEPGHIIVHELPSLRELSTLGAINARDAATFLQRNLGGIRLVQDEDAERDQIWAASATSTQVLAQVPSSDPYQSLSLTLGDGAALIQTTNSSAGTATLTTYDLSGLDPRRVGSSARQQLTSFGDAVGDHGRIIVSSDVVTDVTTGERVALSGGNGLTASLNTIVLDSDRTVLRQTTPTRYATGTAKTTLFLWDAVGGTLIGQWADPLPAPLGPAGIDSEIRQLGDRIATVRPDGSVALWRMRPTSWTSQLCELVGDLAEPERQQYLGDVDAQPICLSATPRTDNKAQSPQLGITPSAWLAVAVVALLLGTGMLIIDRARRAATPTVEQTQRSEGGVG